MSVLYRTIINPGRKLIGTPSCKCFFIRRYSEVPKKFFSFDEVITQKRQEARRSLVVQVNSESSYNELYGYCAKYATIQGVHHYNNSGGEHFMLLEFSSEDDVQNVLQNCGVHHKDLDVMALQTPFLWFRAVSGKKESLITPTSKLLIKEGSLILPEEKLFEELVNSETVSSQIQLLYDRTRLNDLGIRLRYMVARQIEVVFKSLYANIIVQPFGSSVNGFGRMGCDLDLVLTNTLTDEMCSPSKRLVYQEKKCEGGRSPWQRHMELVGELLELRVSGASHVQRILHARVPIVKYHHQYTDVDCDLCYTNMSGVHMSELLWLFGSLDPRVWPLTFTVRRWARSVGLTNAHPGRWITNFPLTLMVIFFLQQKGRDGVVLPTVKQLVRHAGKEDVRIAEENLNCTFLRDMNKLPQEMFSQSSESLESLLLRFFEFYAQFDFQEKAISINEGVPVRKPNSLPLYIVNPLEQALNVSRNVSYDECERLRMEVRNAAWQLDAELERNKADDWGIVGLLEKRTTRSLKKLLRAGNSHRLVSVKDLFKESEDDVSSSNNLRPSKLQNFTRKGEQLIEKSVKQLKDALSKDEKKDVKIKFKNSQVASEVYRIRRDKMV